MRATATHTAKPDQAGARARRALPFVARAIAIGLLIAGCGGGSPSKLSRPAKRGELRQAVRRVRCLHALARVARLSRPANLKLRCPGAGEDLTRQPQSQLAGVQDRDTSLPQAPAQRRSAARCRCQRRAGTSAGPEVRGLHALARSAELSRPRPRRGVQPPFRDQPASAPVPERDASLHKGAAKLTHDQSGSRWLMTRSPQARR